jgi:hypothetical protein
MRLGARFAESSGGGGCYYSSHTFHSVLGRFHPNTFPALHPVSLQTCLRKGRWVQNNGDKWKMAGLTPGAAHLGTFTACEASSETRRSEESMETASPDTG